MLDFSSDYVRGCHSEILEALKACNGQDYPGYGNDEITERAKRRIRAACATPDAEIFLLEGGTQVNQIATKILLTPWQGVIAADTAHVALHEAGAIEHAGHKVIALPGQDGKITAAQVEACLEQDATDENREHMVEPGMVYITYPTEYGTLYSLEELEQIARVCHRFDIPLYLDGARLGYGLAVPDADVTLPDIARLCDCFYIGGTKLGALLGEALVFPHKRISRLLSLVKQSGALLAKGWVLGVQFDTLFSNASCDSDGEGARAEVACVTDDLPDGAFEKSLYMRGARRAIDHAALLVQGLREKGYEFAVDSPTNQQFVIVDDELLARIPDTVRYGFWERLEDGRTVIRFATSWYTTEEDVRALLDLL